MEAHDSLPYIDGNLTELERDAVNQLIQRELPKQSKTQLHPSLRPLPETKISLLLQQEIARVGAKQPRVGGIDLSRYEAPDEPSGDDDIEKWQQALRTVDTSSTYLSERRTNLDLLEEYGKNAWLVGNSELESILKSLEKELAEVKAQTNEMNKIRKTAQEGSKGELLGLEDAWKRGIGKVIEVQVATEQLRQEMHQRQNNTTT